MQDRNQLSLMVQRPALSPDRSLALYTNIFGVFPDQAAAFITRCSTRSSKGAAQPRQTDPTSKVNTYPGWVSAPRRLAWPRREARLSTPLCSAPLRAGLRLRLRCGAGAGRGEERRGGAPLLVLRAPARARTFSLRAVSGNRSEQRWD